jgi:pimeloyl-ACP methyl ester carboxylesterase
MHLLLLLALAYVGLALLVMCLQRKMLYIPTRMNAGLAAHLAAQEGFLPWHNERGESIGWKVVPSHPATASVLVVHGNAGCALDRGYLTQPISQAESVEVFVLEYPGYGARGGSPSLKAWLAAADDAIAAIPTTRPLYVVSESIGTGVGAHLAKAHARRVAGLVCFAPYDKLTAVGQRQMPFLPVSLLLWDRFHPAAWLADYRGPVWFVVAGADTIIPPEFGHRLHDGYAGPKHLQLVAGAGHNDVASQSPAWWREVFKFWQQHARK